MMNRQPIVAKAVYCGLGTFAVLYLGFILLVTFSDIDSLPLVFWLQILLLTMSGFVAGYIAKGNGAVNGAVVGLVAPVVIAIGFSIVTGELNIGPQILKGLGIGWLIQSVFLCSLGGFIYDFISKFR